MKTSRPVRSPSRDRTGSGARRALVITMLVLAVLSLVSSPRMVVARRPGESAGDVVQSGHVPAVARRRLVSMARVGPEEWLHWARRLRKRVAFALDPKIDRHVLEQHVFPDLLSFADVQQVLFVGCEWYTRAYPEAFADRHFRTIDIDPAKARFGSADHIVGSMTDLDGLLPRASYDAVVANGVIGFGLDDKAACERAIAASAAVLRPGGWLVIGWNDVDDLRTVRLDELEALRDFEPVALPSFPAARHPTFSPARHTFDFYRRRPFEASATT